MRRSGYTFLIIASLVFLAAINSGSNLLYLVFAGLTSFLLLSVVASWMTLRRIVMTRDVPEAVNRGEPFRVVVRLENRKRLFPVVALRVENASRPGESLGFILKIPGGKAAVLRISDKYDKRGVHVLPPLVLISTFPFGLVESRLEIGDNTQVVVYPRVLAVRMSTLESMPEATRAPLAGRGKGDEFFSLRDYTPGDDVRHIAWRASARMGTWLVKEVQQEASRLVVFLFDTGKRTDLEDFDERFEDAVELVASLAVTLLQRQYRVAIITKTGELPEGEGAAQLLKVLDFLARVMPDQIPAKSWSLQPPALAAGRSAAYVSVSADPREWGVRSGPGGRKVLDPRQVIRA